MLHIEKLLKERPFEYNTNRKNQLFFPAMIEAMDLHQKTNSVFNIWTKKSQYNSESFKSLTELPFFPSAVFKYMTISNNNNNVKTLKTIESSGTTSQKKSQIIIDSVTSKRQSQVLSKILNVIIRQRKPYFIIDKDPKVKSASKNYSARLAGMSGYLIGARNRHYCITDQNKELFFDFDFFKESIKNYNSKSQSVIIIGYTYMIYKHIISNSYLNTKIQLPYNTKLVHFGGWKKLKDERISKIEFNNLLIDKLGIELENIIDIYGFTEQLGTVYPSFGNSGNLVPIYSDIIIRDPNSLLPVNDGKEGLIQFISPIPNSYPGISLLNDDIGRIIINPKTYNNIKQFEITGRPDNAEDRGCGDTLPEDYYI